MTMLNNTTLRLTAYTSMMMLALAAMPVDAASARFHRTNAAGGATVGADHAVTGSNGGSYVGGHVAAGDGKGGAGVAQAGRVTGSNGARFARAGKTTRQADGSVTHNSGFNASGARGMAESQGTFNRSADGTAASSRTTTVTGTAGGNASTTRNFDRTASGTTAERDTMATNSAGSSYKGQTTYNSQTGVTHMSTCANASGQVAACPR
jgi:hypothetical protein